MYRGNKTGYADICILLNESANIRIIITSITRFGFTEDMSMLRSSLIVIERDGGCEAAMSKIEKGEVENGTHRTDFPCWCRRDVENGTVSSSLSIKEWDLSGAAERTAAWDPR